MQSGEALKVVIRRNRKPGRRQAQRHLCAGLGCGPKEKKEPPGDESHNIGDNDALTKPWGVGA